MPEWSEQLVSCRLCVYKPDVLTSATSWGPQRWPGLICCSRLTSHMDSLQYIFKNVHKNANNFGIWKVAACVRTIEDVLQLHLNKIQWQFLNTDVNSDWCEKNSQLTLKKRLGCPFTCLFCKVIDAIWKDRLNCYPSWYCSPFCHTDCINLCFFPLLLCFVAQDVWSEWRRKTGPFRDGKVMCNFISLWSCLDWNPLSESWYKWKFECID